MCKHGRTSIEGLFGNVDLRQRRVSNKNVNAIAEITYLKNKKLQDKKKGQKLNKKSLSHNGSDVIQISRKFIQELREVAEMDERINELNLQAEQRIIVSLKEKPSKSAG